MLKYIWQMFQKILVGTALASKATVAMIVPIQAEDNKNIWLNVRKEMESSERQSELPETISKPILEALASGIDYEQTIRFSYAALPEELWEKLDKFWLEQPELQTNNQVFQLYVTIRTPMADAFPVTQQSLTEKWIHKAHHRPTHYDNGGGND
jgi:hypothetical protein